MTCIIITLKIISVSFLDLLKKSKRLRIQIKHNIDIIVLSFSYIRNEISNILLSKEYLSNQVSSPITKYTELEPALCQELKKIVEAVVVPGKGLLACDESPASLQKRFDELGVENTETNRRNYRQMLFSADKVIIL